MPHYRITLAYAGTDFEGWRLQGRGGPVRTVQGVVERALARLAGGGRVPVVAAGRTDTGVHALGQVASFELPRGLAAADLLRALNGLLPRDVRVLEAAPAPDGFHARRSARSKQYRYVLDTGPVQIPTRRRFAGHVPFRLDRSRVEEAAALYLGQRDFAPLPSAGGPVRTPARTSTPSH